MAEQISSKLFSDLHDAVEECEEASSDGSSNVSHLDITFDINHLTETDTKSSTVLYFLERAAPGLKKKTLKELLQKMLHLQKLSSVITIGRDDEEEDWESAGSIVENEDLVGGLLAAIPFQGTISTKDNAFREEFCTMLQTESCGTVAKYFQEIRPDTNDLYFLINERAPYIPNQVAAQALANILEETIAQSTKPVSLFVLAKLQYLEGNESQNESQPMKKKRRQANESSAPAALSMRKVQFVKPEEELFVTFQESVQKVGEDFMVSPTCENIVFRSTSENPIAYDDFFMVPMIVHLSARIGSKSKSPTVGEWIIKELRSFES